MLLLPVLGVWRCVMVMKKAAGKVGKSLKAGMAGAGAVKGKPPAVGRVAGVVGKAKPLPGVAGTAYNKGMARMQKAGKLAAAGLGARMSKKPV